MINHVNPNQEAPAEDMLSSAFHPNLDGSRLPVSAVVNTGISLPFVILCLALSNGERLASFGRLSTNGNAKMAFAMQKSKGASFHFSVPGAGRTKR